MRVECTLNNFCEGERDIYQERERERERERDRRARERGDRERKREDEKNIFFID